MNSGLLNGSQQGVKSGMALSNMLNGKRSGGNSTMPKRKMQDPVVISTAINDCPFHYWNADNVTLSGSSVIDVPNLLNTYNPLTQSTKSYFTTLGTINKNIGDVFNNRSSLKFNTSSTVFGRQNDSSPSMTNTSEMTLMMVCELNSVGRSVLFWKKDGSSDPVFLDTVGDLSVEYDGTNIDVFFVGNPTTQKCQYRAVDATMKNNWVLITVKARLYNPQGLGSCIDIFINGKRCKNLVSDTITSFGATPGGLTWDNRYILFGNSSVFGNSGNRLAMGFITEQWMNESEQIRLENYFRWYYGNKF